MKSNKVQYGYKEQNNDYMKFHKEESAQLTNAIWRIFNEDNGNTFDKNMHMYGSNKTHLNGTSMIGSEPVITGR